MFIILNKEKMLAYGISVLTIIMLFGIANGTCRLLIEKDIKDATCSIKKIK